jgi:hypothetical protein
VEEERGGARARVRERRAAAHVEEEEGKKNLMYD